MPIALTKDQETQIVASLQRYFREELDQEISTMRSRFLLEYIMDEIAPIAYNRAIKDAEAYFRAKLEDLPGSCFAPEFNHSEKQRKKPSQR